MSDPLEPVDEPVEYDELPLPSIACTPMQVNLHDPNTLPFAVDLCMPHVTIEYVTHNGEVVTINGEPVYIVLDD